MAIQGSSRNQIDVGNAAKEIREQESKGESEETYKDTSRIFFPITASLRLQERRGGTAFEKIAIFFTWLVVVLTFPLSLYFCFITIPEYQRAVIFRLGRVRRGAAGPGLVWYLPCIDSYEIVDLRSRVVVIPTQDIITKDALTLTVDAVLFYYVIGSLKSTMKVDDVHEATVLLAQTMVRSVLGTKKLHEILTSRESLSQEIRISCERSTASWGVKIERVALKDISLPEMFHRAMASEAEAIREARAKIISAEGEHSASKALKEASDVMSKNKIALQLRHLQILTSISHERKLKIYYPFPINMLTGLTDSEADTAAAPKNDRPQEENHPLKQSVISMVTNILEPFIRNPTEILEGESFLGTADASRSINEDYQSPPDSQRQISNPDELPLSASPQPDENDNTKGTQTDPKTHK
ncbi:band 7 protein AGAP004871-like [Drosophila navojoa]|uniref:band 7 protein AGAP004871-like n=1 Tax=Drosophila navojoa TaxID=7232 RepID=UPI0008475099|nr:band 7 protein AGAP004871-like [Drosophila navojoa]